MYYASSGVLLQITNVVRKAVKYHCVYFFGLGHSLIKRKGVFQENLAKSREKQHGHIIYSMTYMKFAKYREACRQSARQKVELPPAKMVVTGGASSGYCFYLQDKLSHQKT